MKGRNFFAVVLVVVSSMFFLSSISSANEMVIIDRVEMNACYQKGKMKVSAATIALAQGRKIKKLLFEQDWEKVDCSEECVKNTLTWLPALSADKVGGYEGDLKFVLFIASKNFVVYLYDEDWHEDLERILSQ